MIAPGQIHLWSLVKEDLPEPYAGAAVCHASELQRAQRFIFASDKDFYLKRTIALRTILGAYLGEAPENIVISHKCFGKPYLLLSEQTKVALDFNISHSNGQLCIALALNNALGIDIECPQSRLPHTNLWVFSKTEKALLNSLKGAEQSHAFYTIWTLKEAFIKAMGYGLHYPIHKYTIDLTQSCHRLTDHKSGLHWHAQVISKTLQQYTSLSFKNSGVVTHYDQNDFAKLIKARSQHAA